MLKKRLSVNIKILIYIAGLSAIMYLITFSIIIYRSRAQAFNDAKKITELYTEKFANYTSSVLNQNLESIRSLARIFESYKNFNENERRKIFMDLLVRYLKIHDEIKAVWTTWEPYSIDSLDKKYVLKSGSTVLGNFAVLYYKNYGKIILDTTMETNPDQVYDGDFYLTPKKTLKETIIEPYYYSYSKDKKNEILETSFVIPLISEYKFLGVLGIDIELTDFEKIINNISPFEGGYSFILSNNGTFIYNPLSSWIGKSIKDFQPEWDSVFNIMSNVKEGRAFSFVHRIDETNEKYYFSFYPVNIGKTTSPWSIVIAAPLKTIYYEANLNFKISLIIGITFIIILIVLSFLILKEIIKPLEKIDLLLKKLNKADISELDKIASKNNDEIGDIANSAKTLIEWLNNTTIFAQNLKEGDYNAKYKLINDNDILGKSLIELRNKLILSKEEEEKQKIENEQRNWMSEGIAKFSEIARRNSDNIEKFASEVIFYLVKYIDASIGGFYTVNNDEKEKPYLELIASVAYDRKKLIKKNIYFGDGLIGTCALEKKLIYLNSLPKDYIKITSGLGQAGPSNLIVLPLIYNEQLFGVIEIATIKEPEKYKIDFIEEVCNIIASTINTIKINSRTSMLLEDSKNTSEQLSQHEEEMRQNYEELQTAQEELLKTRSIMEQKINYYNEIFDSIPIPIMIVDMQGKIENINKRFSELTSYKINEIKDSPVNLILKKIATDDFSTNDSINTTMTLKNETEINVTINTSISKQHENIYYILIVNEQLN
jgi:methyl-accepting chemotaxis protein